MMVLSQVRPLQCVTAKRKGRRKLRKDCAAPSVQSTLGPGSVSRWSYRAFGPCVLQQAGAADRKTEKKKLTEIKGTRRDREAKHGARAQQIQRRRSKMFGTAKQSDLRDCIKGTE